MFDKKNKIAAFVSTTTKKLGVALVGLGMIATAGTAAMVALPSQVQAQITIPIILVIDRNQILNQSLAGKSVNDQAKQLQETIGKELEKEFTSIKTEQEQLNAQAALLSAEVLKTRTDKLTEKIRVYERNQQFKNTEFRASVSYATGKISEALTPILEEILKERSATLLLDKSVTIFANQDIEVTPEVMKRLDEKIKTVELVRIKVDEAGNPIFPEGAKPKESASAADNKKNKKN